MPQRTAGTKGYMTVGEVANKMGVTVRTLQYYDKEGLLSPSAQSEGGRRLYSDQDLVQLHQILSMKHLGFSLDDIKNRLVFLDTPAKVADALAGQAEVLREKIATLSASLKDIETLREEVLQMQTVNFKKYADIIVNLQMNNEYYWLIKHFDDQMLDHIRRRFDKDSGNAMMQTFQHLQKKAIRLSRDGILPESKEGQKLAEEFWQMIIEFTDGDMSMLPKLMELEGFDNLDEEWRKNQMEANEFIGPALDTYFEKQGINPFEEAGE